MRVPHELLRETATVRDYEGAGARGPVFAEGRELRCQLQQTDALVVDSRGVQVQVHDLMVIRPEDGPVAAESRVSAAGLEFRVVRCYAMPDTRRPYFYQIQLAAYAPGDAGGSGS